MVHSRYELKALILLTLHMENLGLYLTSGVFPDAVPLYVPALFSQ